LFGSFSKNEVWFLSLPKNCVFRTTKGFETNEIFGNRINFGGPFPNCKKKQCFWSFSTPKNSVGPVHKNSVFVIKRSLVLSLSEKQGFSDQRSFWEELKVWGKEMG